MSSSPATFTLEPQWRDRRQIRHAQIPYEMQTWLYNDDSLTARLKTGCADAFRVEVLKQRYARIQRNEEQALGIPHRRVALLREVYLYCGATRVVYARSIIPTTTLSGKQKRLASLGERPLGGFLFACPSMQREAIELAELCRGDSVYDQAVAQINERPVSVWGRRSVFRLQDKPLLVAEIFLPGISIINM